MGKLVKLTPAQRKRIGRRYAIQISVTPLAGGGVTVKLIPDTVWLKSGDYATLPESTRWFGSLADVKREYAGSQWMSGRNTDHISGWMVDGVFIQCCAAPSRADSMGYFCELPDRHPGMHDWEAVDARYAAQAAAYAAAQAKEGATT